MWNLIEMGRPRESAKILAMKGAFAKNPDRAREDLPGAGPLATDPPDHLTGAEKAAWRRIHDRIPREALSSSEEIALAQAARALAALDVCTPMMGPIYVALDARLQAWLAELGLGLKARAALGTAVGKKRGNKFAEFTEPQRPAG